MVACVLNRICLNRASRIEHCECFTCPFRYCLSLCIAVVYARSQLKALLVGDLKK